MTTGLGHHAVNSHLQTGTTLNFRVCHALAHGQRQKQQQGFNLSAPCHVAFVHGELPEQGAGGTEPDEQLGRSGPAVTQHQAAEATAAEERALRATGARRRAGDTTTNWTGTTQHVDRALPHNEGRLLTG